VCTLLVATSFHFQLTNVTIPLTTHFYEADGCSDPCTVKQICVFRNKTPRHWMSSFMFRKTQHLRLDGPTQHEERTNKFSNRTPRFQNISAKGSEHKHSKIYIFQGPLDPSEKSKTFLRNVGEYHPSDTVSHSRRLGSSD